MLDWYRLTLPAGTPWLGQWKPSFNGRQDFVAGIARTWFKGELLSLGLFVRDGALDISLAARELPCQ